MTPTNELRFVEREMPGFRNLLIRVLQQKWVVEYTYSDERTTHIETEWRDVPLVKEEVK
jgi:hypothetical protein